MTVTTRKAAVPSVQSAQDASETFYVPPWIRGNFETDLEPSLRGNIRALISDLPEPGSRYLSIVDANEYWYVFVQWQLYGNVRKMICGKWCVKVFLESLGKDELDLELPEQLIDLNPCGDGYYAALFIVPPNTVKTEHCGTPFQPVVTVTYLTPCSARYDEKDTTLPEYRKYQAGPIAAFVPFPITQFFMEDVEV